MSGNLDAIPPTTAPAPSDDWEARVNVLVERVRMWFAGCYELRDIIIADEKQSGLRVVPYGRAQLILHQLGGLSLVDAVAKCERPEEPSILAVLVFGIHIALVWIPVVCAGFSQRPEESGGPQS